MNVLVNIDVDDLEKGVHFYAEALDLKPGRRFGGAAIYLLANPDCMCFSQFLGRGYDEVAD